MIPFAQLLLTFQGRTYEPERDQARLAHQIVKVFECMKDGKWRTLAEIAKATGEGKRIGMFENEQDAARAYDAAALQQFGEFAYLNFPSEASQ